MTKITFVNGTTPAVNATNLNQMQTNIENAINALIPVVLYNNTSGTTGSVTLSETAANFSYLEIFFGDSSGNYPGLSSVKIYNPNGKRASTTIMQKEGSGATRIRINTRSLNISGTSITVESYQINYINDGGQYTSNEQKIYRVLGYR